MKKNVFIKQILKKILLPIFLIKKNSNNKINQDTRGLYGIFLECHDSSWELYIGFFLPLFLYEQIIFHIMFPQANRKKLL